MALRSKDLGRATDFAAEETVLSEKSKDDCAGSSEKPDVCAAAAATPRTVMARALLQNINTSMRGSSMKPPSLCRIERGCKLYRSVWDAQAIGFPKLLVSMEQVSLIQR